MQKKHDVFRSCACSRGHDSQQLRRPLRPQFRRYQCRLESQHALKKHRYRGPTSCRDHLRQGLGHRKCHAVEPIERSHQTQCFQYQPIDAKGAIASLSTGTIHGRASLNGSSHPTISLAMVLTSCLTVLQRSDLVMDRFIRQFSSNGFGVERMGWRDCHFSGAVC